ncbi:MAG: PAS domain S-box protein [Candidatus Aminicenantes bacterium]|nr:PAS domain S-box protein [Candidatus Aminicenantes bacterium]
MKKKKILIIDDNPKLRETLSDILLLEGYAPSTAASGKAALEKIKRDPPALVLLDLRLEDMDGLKALKEIKKLSPDTECIVIPGYASQESAIESVNLGAYGYIQKPYDVKQLIVFIRRAIEKIEANEALLESEGKYRSLVESCMDPINLVDEQCKYVFMNKAHLKRFNFPMDQVLGREYGDFHSKKETARFKSEVDKVIQKGRFSIHEYQSERDGRYFLRTFSPLVGAKEEITTVTVISKDITELKQLEEELRKEKDYAQGLLKTAPIIVLTLDTKGRIVYFNPYMENLSGYRLEEVKGKDWFSTFITRHDQDHIRELFLKAIGNISTHGNINPIVTKDGEERVIEWYDKTLKDSKGDVIGLLSVGQDITERKKAEKSIKESEEKYREIMNFSPNGLLKISMKGVILECNKSFLKFSGLSKDQVINKHLTKLSTLREKDIPGYIKILTSILIGKLKEPIEFIWVHRNKSIRWSKAHFRILRSAGGEKSILISLTDITKKKQLEDKIKESEKQYRDLVEKAGIAILIDDINGHIRYCNHKLANLFGYSIENMKKLSIRSVVHSDDVERVMKFHGNRVQGKKSPSRYEFKGIRKDGSSVFVEVDAVALKENENFTGSRSYMWDITKRKQAEEKAQQHQEELQKLTAQLFTIQEDERKWISQELHDDIGQALTMLKLNLFSLKDLVDREQTEKIKARLEEFDLSCEKILNSVHEMTLDLRPHMLDDLGLLPTLRWYLNRISKQANVEPHIKSVNWKVPLIPEMEVAIFRIIQEAITNVAKHAMAQNVFIHLKQIKHTVDISIEDDGQGFDVKKIKDLRFQAHGVGLLGMRERISLLQGIFQVDSAPGKGTRISASLPLRRRS